MTMNNNCGTYGTYYQAPYRKPTFTQVWGGEESWSEEGALCALNDGTAGHTLGITNASFTKLYYLLYSRYGNTPIANRDTNQWKYQVWSTILTYAPAWERKIEVLKELREKGLSDVADGGAQSHEEELNPNEAATASDDPFSTNFHSTKHVSRYRKNTIDAATSYYAMLDADPTNELLNRFKPLFMTVLATGKPLLYDDEDEE